MKSDRFALLPLVEGLDKDKLSCVCAFVVRANENDGEEVVEQALRALCESALPRFKQPRRYIFVSETAYTATGKVQRFKLLRATAMQKPDRKGGCRLATAVSK